MSGNIHGEFTAFHYDSDLHHCCREREGERVMVFDTESHVEEMKVNSCWS